MDPQGGTRLLAWALILNCIVTPGCHTCTPMRVLVRESDHHAPIAGAEVKVGYASWFRISPSDSATRTDTEGVAVVRVVADYRFPAWLTVHHSGFHSKDEYRFDIGPRSGESAEGWREPSSSPVLLDGSATLVRAGETVLIELTPHVP